MMNESLPPERHRDLSPDVIVHRSIRASSWVDWETETPNPAAFIRRDPGDSLGLSVILDPSCLPGIKNKTGCAADLSKCYGELQVEAQNVYSQNLGIQLDTSLPQKANITGVPTKNEDEEKAEYIAGVLAKLCKVNARDRESK